MSNIKIIDGLIINLDLTFEIDIRCENQQEGYRLGFMTKIGAVLGVVWGKKFYKSKGEADKRVQEILSKQNSNEIEI
jgi:hypothetical protein